jgi:hypothetical protein
MSIQDTIHDELPLFRVWLGQNKMRASILALLAFTLGVIVKSCV